jgi:hypothetical protein
MMRYSALIPTAILVAVPLWTAASLPVVIIGVVAGLFCGIGVLRLWLPSITAGGSLALIDYALAASLAGSGLDIVGAAAFGLALLFLLDLAEFAGRFRGAEITAAVRRTQIAFWLGRAAVATAAVALLTLGAAVLAYLIPVLGRPIVAGLGAAITFAGAMHAGIVRDRNEL